MKRMDKKQIAIIVYIILFAICIALILSIIIRIYSKPINDTSEITKLQGILDPTKTTPGLTIEPRMHNISPLLWYSTKNLTTNVNYIEKIKHLLRGYPDELSKSEECQKMIIRPSDIDIKQWIKYRYGYTHCPFSVKSLLGPCSEGNYGYDNINLQPCLYITINKISGWVPVGFSHEKEIPNDIPQKLKQIMMSSLKTLNDSSQSGPDRAWIWCEGKYPYDNEHFNTIEYYPHPWIDAQYFPYTWHLDYDQPMIAIRIIKPKMDTLIAIRCNLYTSNINSAKSYLNAKNDFTNPSFWSGKPGPGYSEIHLYFSKTV